MAVKKVVMKVWVSDRIPDGTIEIDVHPDWAPLGAQRFLDLVGKGYYNEVRIARVIDGFMAQFGINGDPKTYEEVGNVQIKDDPVKQSNTRGKISFAMRGPNTRSCQIFINYGNNGNLDGQGFSPFAEVTRGMEIVDAFHRQECDQSAMKQQGMAYLKDFPQLSYIKTAEIVA
eukprot:TRINITY_DN64816_c0_g1_i1.p1 TRINITY_DN64816_c0_g1~~TRINITY_DN64816_c0_g1_i1.p1  ORF type:complete len:193 (-),score=46.42 TRINITY_DN64816_c0_g1_i1:101-619(-)